MSFPNIPNVTSMISITQGQAIDLLLASIAFEELGLSHILNAEGEKIQSVVGTLPGLTPTVVPIGDLQAIDTSVTNTLHHIIKKEMLLEFKLEDLIQLIQLTICPCTVTLDVIASTFPGVTIQTVDGNLEITALGTTVNFGPVAQSIIDCEPNIPSVTVANSTTISIFTFTFSVTITTEGPTGVVTMTVSGVPIMSPIEGTSTITCSPS
jgi:hypothetical protein